MNADETICVIGTSDGPSRTKIEHLLRQKYTEGIMDYSWTEKALN